MKWRHLDLFSGIGGNSYAADQVFDEIDHIFCEINPFCRSVLQKHWPEARIYEDIKKLNTSEIESIDVLTAGVPCQPASSAGNRRGTEDDRWLWPRTLEVVFATRPRYAIFENPPGLLTLQRGVPFQDILSSLGTGGYETQIINIPASGVEAPHERQRIFIVAHDTRQRVQRIDVAKQRKQDRKNSHPSGSHSGTADVIGTKIWKTERTGKKCESTSVSRNHNQFSTNSHSFGGESRVGQARSEEREAFSRHHWADNAIEDIYRLCTPLHGISRRLVRLPDGSSISEAKWRNETIQAAGNAVVPQQVVPIMRAIKEVEESGKMSI